VGQVERQNSAPGAGRTPLWRDVRGKSSYRVFGALVLDELCQAAVLKSAELLRRLRKELHRSMSRQSLAAWRRGDQPAPDDVVLATSTVVRRTLAEASMTVVTRVLGDPDAEPHFAEWLRFYFANGRPEIPADPPAWGVGEKGVFRRPKSNRRDRDTPLWRDLRGKTSYRVFGALVLDELCQETDLTIEELRRRVGKELRRPLSRQTLATWRRADQSIPIDVPLAMAAIVGRTLSEPTLTVIARVLSDPDTDPHFAEWLALYLGHGRA
jgi:hypothetical protein